MELLDYNYKNPWMDPTPENGSGDFITYKNQKLYTIKTLFVWEDCMIRAKKLCIIVCCVGIFETRF